MQYQFQNVNHAFRELVTGIADGSIPTIREPSRVGDVIRIPEPVLICYQRPWERVLLNPARDCNPFFHLFEALWMLAGRDDVRTLVKYNSRMVEFSDDGTTFNGAYGFRWRNHMIEGSSQSQIIDQIHEVIEHLTLDPNSRRAVIQMWNVEDDLLQIDKSKDVCCNLSVMLSIRDNAQSKFLDMTVTNRSNDLIWGTLGANVVHFSFLQEYIAGKLGINIGYYYHFTNNLHVYSELWEENHGNWLMPYAFTRTSHDPPIDYTDALRDRVALCSQMCKFDVELPAFVDALGDTDGDRNWDSPFLHMVAWPMELAWRAHKQREYELSLDYCKAIMSADWRQEATRWIKQRQEMYETRTNKA